MKRLLSILMVTCLIALPSLTGAEGKLNAFEESATGDSSHSRYEYESDDDHDSLADHLFGDIFAEVFGFLFVYGGDNSLMIVEESRPDGDVRLPTARLDFTYQNVESDVYAYDARFELGYGPWALYYNGTRYLELHPTDHLDITRFFLMFRSTFTDVLEIDLGMGTLDIDGDNHHTKLCLTTPILIRSSENTAVEIRPAWADRVTDLDVSLLINTDYASLKLGYRIVDAPAESLNGPYIGLSFYY